MKRKPTLLEALSTIIVMIIIVITGFTIFEIPIQALLILASAYAAFIAKRVGLSWKDLEEGITKRLATAMPAIFIILAVGIIVGPWTYSGTVPALIYYGLEFLNPTFFLVSAFIICAITSVATGTAWGSASTAGIALMAISTNLGLNPGMTAGAIIAGAVFGDKMSPLSDTTNLAALVTKVNVFSHIRAMLWTTIPASLVGIVVWLIAGTQASGNTDEKQINGLMGEIASIYNINFLTWVPVIVIVACLLFKISTVPSMLASGLSAIIVGAINNGFSIVDGFQASFDGFKPKYIPNHGDLSDRATDLVTQGGMMSMTEIIVTIFCGYAFAGIIERSGCLEVILRRIAANIHTVGQLILATVICGLMMVLAAGVASVVIIIVGVLMLEMYDKMDLDRTNLSRTLEDSGTMIIPLIPWGTSGIYYTQQLGVAFDQFFIWTVPCYLCVVFALIYGFTGIGIKKKPSSSK